jgi:hypothetical protein
MQGLGCGLLWNMRAPGPARDEERMRGDAGMIIGVRQEGGAREKAGKLRK